MEFMKRHVFLSLLVLLLLGALLRAEDKSSNLKFVVVKAYNGKPIRNAAVVLHPVDKDGRQAKGGFELKTDHDGEARFSGAPYGKLRVQVLARGFQTFGQDYDINQPEHHFTIKLNRPQQQYSIYDDHHPRQEKPKQ
jgi:hypothetical protein